jgi:uncharacterized RDD family membrane protein YckC
VTDGEGISNRASPPPASTVPAHPLDDKYYVRGETEAYGPYGGFTVKDMIEQGKLGPDSGIAKVGETGWTAIKDHLYFSKLRHGRAAEPMRLPGSAAYESGPAQGHKQFVYAGFWIRVAASLIDQVILAPVLLIIYGAIFGLAFSSGAGQRGEISAAAGLVLALGLIALIALPCLYHVLFLRGRWQATPGKRLLNLYVITLPGNPVSGWRALGRYLCLAFVSPELFGLGLMMAGWTKEKRAFHDSICDTRVVYGKL